MTKLIFAFTLALLSSFSSAAQWVTNKDHSEILFQVPYLGVSELTGRFNEFSGEIELESDGEARQLEVRINSSSIDTGNKMRDNHLRGSDFFQGQQHPHITFKSQRIVQTKPNSYKATGELTIKGITKPATIEFTSSATVKDTWGFENKFVKFKSTVNRKDYKMNWNKTLDGQQLLVGDEVTFWGTFQMQPAQAKTPNSKHMIPDTEYIRERDLQRLKGEEKKPDEEESTFTKKIRDLINGK